MDFNLSDENRQVRDMVYNFAQKEIVPVAQQNDAEGKFLNQTLFLNLGQALLGGPQAGP